MATSSACRPTRIHDLPTECLVEILCRVGNPPLPIRTPTRTDGRKNITVTHPIQCALVSKRWRILTPAAVRSLSLDLNRITLPPLLAEDLGLEFCNLNTLALILTHPPSPATLRRIRLADLEFLAAHLTDLKVLFPVTRTTVRSFLRILTACRGTLTSLTLDLRRAHSLTESELNLVLDAVCTLPLLLTLRLGYHTSSPNSHEPPEMWSRLGAMPGLREIHLESNVTPLGSLGRIPSILHSLDLTGSLLGPQGMRAWHPQAAGMLLTNLTSLTLRNNTRISLPETLRCLKGLTQLRVKGWKRLVTLTPLLNELSRLRVLSLTDCSALRWLPDSIGDLRELRVLKVDSCHIFPESLGNLTCLKTLHVKGQLLLSANAGPLKCLQERIGQLSHLRSLRLVSCRSLPHLSECLGNLTSLEELEIGYCPVNSLPESLTRLDRLRVCTLALPDMNALPELIGAWLSLEKLVIKCRLISGLPDSLCNLTSLQDLTLKHCLELVELPGGFANLSALKRLNFVKCLKLRALPEDLGRLGGLESLSVSHCGHLRRLPASMRELSAMRELCVRWCIGLEDLPEGVQSLPGLEVLHCPASLLSVFLETSPAWVGVGPEHARLSDSDDDLDPDYGSGVVQFVDVAWEEEDEE